VSEVLYWSDFLRILLRRWYVFVPSLIVTFALAYVVSTSAAPTYRASSTLLLLPGASSAPAGQATPSAPSGQATTNRLSALPLTSVSTILAQALEGYEVAEQLRQLGLQGTFAATATQNGSPLVTLSVEDKSASVANRRLSVLTRLANQQLEVWQGTSVSAARITADSIVSSGPPTALYGSRIRALLVGCAIGAIASLALAFLVENEAYRRQHRWLGDQDDTHAPALEAAPESGERRAPQRVME